MTEIGSPGTSWILTTVDDVDELYSNLLYMPPKIVQTPDGQQWEVWAEDTRGVRIELQRLNSDGACGEVLVVDSFARAFNYLSGGRVVFQP
jgi:hypothetical protein